MADLDDHLGPGPWLSPVGAPTDDHDSFGWKLFVACVVMVVSSVTFTSLRIWTRVSTKQLGWDDYTCVFAQLTAIVNVICWTISVKKGYGVDTDVLSTTQIQAFLRWFFIGQPFYLATVTGYKISIILLSQRIFIQKPFQIACWLLISCCVIAFLTIFFLTVFQCYPMNTMWGHASETAKCIEINNMLKAWAGWNIASDATILILPLPVISQLNLKLRQKILLSGVFLLGTFVCIFSILSASNLIEGIANRANKYSFSASNMFQVIEENMGIIGSCLPVLHHPLRRLWPRIFKTTTPGGSGPRPNRSPYYQDGFHENYAMGSLGRSGNRKTETKHTVSVTGPEGPFTSSRRKGSDELGIIHQTSETRVSSEENVAATSMARGAYR